MIKRVADALKGKGVKLKATKSICLLHGKVTGFKLPVFGS